MSDLCFRSTLSESQPGHWQYWPRFFLPVPPGKWLTSTLNWVTTIIFQSFQIHHSMLFSLESCNKLQIYKHKLMKDEFWVQNVYEIRNRVLKLSEAADWTNYQKFRKRNRIDEMWWRHKTYGSLFDSHAILAVIIVYICAWDVQFCLFTLFRARPPVNCKIRRTECAHGFGDHDDAPVASSCFVCLMSLDS